MFILFLGIGHTSLIYLIIEHIHINKLPYSCRRELSGAYAERCKWIMYLGCRLRVIQVLYYTNLRFFTLTLSPGANAGWPHVQCFRAPAPLQDVARLQLAFRQSAQDFRGGSDCPEMGL
jgi:hypothetical protein